MGNDWKANARLIQKARPSFDLYPDEYPMLVRFRDINDPASVEAVAPNEFADQFGMGVALKRINIAVDDQDDVTVDIIKRLQWLKDYRGKYLDGTSYSSSNRLTNFLSGGAFTTEW